MVCDGPALRLFNVSELEVLICGSPKFDFHDLEESCMYQGFEPDSEPITWFWEVVNSFTIEQKKKLLVFSTGSDRAPVGGLQNLNFVIVKHGDEDDRFFFFFFFFSCEIELFCFVYFLSLTPFPFSPPGSHNLTLASMCCYFQITQLRRCWRRDSLQPSKTAKGLGCFESKNFQ